MELLAGILTGVPKDEFLLWLVAGAVGVIALATVANFLALALDLEAS